MASYDNRAATRVRLIAGRKLRIELMPLRKNEQLGFDFEEDVEMGELF